MTQACQYIHDKVSYLPRLRRDDLTKVPANGVYVLFEKGEVGHGADRVVRVGTHRGQNNLAGRIHEHLYTPNKDRSIFRKHVGRCLLAKDEDPFLAQWEIDLTTRAAREMNAHKVDQVRLEQVEDQVTQYMAQNFSFAVLQVQEKAERLHLEECLLSTIFDCRECGPSAAWLGKLHPTSEIIRSSGLWNVQSLRRHVLLLNEAQSLILKTRCATVQPDLTMTKLQQVLSYCRENDRVCPIPQQWTNLWELLPDKQQQSSGWEPPLPLILGGWWETSDEEKRERLERHLRWAAEHGVLAQVAQFLLSLPEGEWHHGGE